MDRPLCERRALLESGACFLPIPRYLELSEARRVRDVTAPERPLHALFAAARAAGEEGLMLTPAIRN